MPVALSRAKALFMEIMFYRLGQCFHITKMNCNTKKYRD